MKEKNRTKKLSSAISALVVSVFMAFAFVFPAVDYVLGHKYRGYKDLYPVIVGLVGVVLILCMVYIVKQRFKDLDKGQEDDIDKY